MIKIVLSTINSKARARELASTLVSARLAACVNIVPNVASVYHWEGTVEEAEENLLIIKTSSSRLPKLIETLKSIHPYDLPEVVALNSDEGLASYFRWVEAETSVEKQ